MTSTRMVQRQNSEMKKQCGFELKQKCEFSSVELIEVPWYGRYGFMGMDYEMKLPEIALGKL